MTQHGRTAALVWGSEPPVFSIGYETPSSPGDSGFSVLFDDAPDPDDVTPGDPRVQWVCLHCLIDDNPEIGRGLEVARGWGAADLDDDGEWVGRTVEA